ncbi:MAG: bifunctional aspartate kinase/homoserine dehydrogenase I [Bacteroidota bacterium]
MSRLLVAKFGGTSVATPERIRHAVGLVRTTMPEACRRIVVVSAMGRARPEGRGVTDALLDAIAAALDRTGEHRSLLDALRRRYLDAVATLAPLEERADLRAEQNALWGEAGDLLDGVWLLRECTPRTRDAILSFGERANAPLVAAAMRGDGLAAQALDAREVIRTDSRFGHAEVDFQATRERAHAAFADIPDETIVVATGFIATDAHGVTTTLGRSGSDYTATILADALNADEVTIWTDVDGVLTADPSLVAEAQTLAELSYKEAAELAYFGAKVLHPRTMQPVARKAIRLVTRNTMDPAAPSTVIGPSQPPSGRDTVKAVTSIRDVGVLVFEGAALYQHPRASSEALAALAEASVPVLMISQASSEQSLCVVVFGADREKALVALSGAFATQIERGDVRVSALVEPHALVAVVGEAMRNQSGVAGRMMATLGKAGINITAIAQGSSELNISVAIADEDTPAAVRALHEAFPMNRLRAHLAVVGVGVVGSELLDQLAAQTVPLLEHVDLNLRLVGLSSSQRSAFDAGGLDPADWQAALDAGTGDGFDALVDAFLDARLERKILVDATASADVAQRYPQLLEAGIAVVTPNKRGNTLDAEFYADIRRAARLQRAPYLYETTVGAGLPVISTLRDQLRSGDRVRRIEGVFSGTMAFLFNALADGQSFSEAVREAKQRGLTEPDPRDDLGGEDVARKLLILAREMGLDAEMADVQVESLVPERLRDGSIDAYLTGIADDDAAWTERVEHTRAAGKRLQFVGQILTREGSTSGEGCTLCVGVQAVGPDSALYNLRGTDNLIVYTTDRYLDRPLVVQGPGAGPAVTAAVVLADVIRAAELMS